MKLQVQHIPIPLGHNFLRRVAGVNPLIVNYHMVSDHILPYIKHLYNYRSVSEFQRDISFYSRHYRFIGMDELLGHLKNSTPLPDHSLMLTFDDGFREVYETIAPFLEERKIPATFFLTTDFIDNKSYNHDNRQSLLVEEILNESNTGLHSEIELFLGENDVTGQSLKAKILNIPYRKRSLIDDVAGMLGADLSQIMSSYLPHMTSDQVMELVNSGFAIGGHSLDHARFNELSMAEQVTQTTTCMDLLAEKYDLDYRVFAFPYSDIGISSEYFNAISEDVDATFGTQGLLSDPVSSNFQRISGEKFPFSARRNTKYQFTRRIIKTAIRKNEVVRAQHQ